MNRRIVQHDDRLARHLPDQAIEKGNHIGARSTVCVSVSHTSPAPFCKHRNLGRSTIFAALCAWQTL